MRMICSLSLVAWICGVDAGLAIGQTDKDPSARPAVVQSRGPFGADSMEVPSALEPENGPPAKLAVLSEDDLNELLGRRLKGQMGMTFGQFGNMFMVTSRLNIGTGIGLMSENRKIVRSPLQSPFPETYHPTLREFLDAIALQTSSEWKYETTSKYFKSDIKSSKPVEGVAIFEFTAAKRAKPFKITMAEGWKSEDKGNWMMYIPVEFPVGMDIYEMGTYSTENGNDTQQEFLDKIRLDVALDWAKRVSPRAKASDLKEAKVGKFEALHCDVLLKGQDKKEIRWRHWVFMDGSKCYFVVSTILPKYEDAIYPDVKEMLESFTTDLEAK